MQKLSFLILFSLLFSCKNQTHNNLAFVNREALDANGSTMLIGCCTRGALLREPYKNWFEPNYQAYQADKLMVSDLKAKINEYEITIFLGTWCGDTRREVPKFLKILDEAQYKKAIKLVMVDNATERYKQSPNHEEEGKNIFRVPTFIIEKNGVEVNRIIETPIETLEKDLVNIVSPKPYEPSYRAVSRYIEIKQQKGNHYIENNYLTVANEIKPFMKSSSELNGYGYVLLGMKKFEEAITLFTLQTYVVPNDANTFDSLAEAYLLAGKKKLAIQNYEKAVQINPNFESSVNMLKKLKG